MSELKPCPFCGGEADHIDTWDCKQRVFCTECGAKIERKHWFEKDSDEFQAFNAWNRRVNHDH